MSAGRDNFLASLRAGLQGLPPRTVEEVLGEYAVHFDEGASANRSDEEIARALGNPATLAEELRVEMQIEQWEARRTPGSAISTIYRVAGLGVLNAALLFVVGPIVVLLGAFMLILVVALLWASVWLVVAADSLTLPGGMTATLLASAGSIFAAISLAALLALGVTGLVNALARYARLHYRHLPNSNRQGNQS
jgi:uncharacterized membrane protein